MRTLSETTRKAAEAVSANTEALGRRAAALEARLAACRRQHAAQKSDADKKGRARAGTRQDGRTVNVPGGGGH